MLQPPRCIKLPVERGHEKDQIELTENLYIKSNRRVIYKGGATNIRFSNIPRKSVKFIKDFATTLVELKWRYTMIIFTLSFFVSWAIFAVLWQLIADAHGDLDFDPITGARQGDGEMPCAMGATDFWGFFLLSIETQITTGYGEKYPSEECPEAIFLLMFQCFVGIVIEGAMVGVIYAKMSKPKPSTKKFQFSKLATICQRDGELCLLFRVADSRSQLQINSRVQAYFCSKKMSQEGEDIHELQEQMQLFDDGKVNLIWPVIVSHVIDKDSPLYKIDAKQLSEAEFEIVVVLSGNSKDTGQVAQARTSYLPHEIIWGHRFQNIIHYDALEQVYRVDYEQFDSIYLFPTPMNSAAELIEARPKPKEPSKGVSLPNLKVAKRNSKSESEKKNNVNFAMSESGLKLNIDHDILSKRDSAMPSGSLEDYDEEDDDNAEETDEFDDSLIQSTTTILERRDKLLFKKLRPTEWNSDRVVSSPNIWHKD